MIKKDYFLRLYSNDYHKKKDYSLHGVKENENKKRLFSFSKLLLDFWERRKNESLVCDFS